MGLFRELLDRLVWIILWRWGFWEALAYSVLSRGCQSAGFHYHFGQLVFKTTTSWGERCEQGKLKYYKAHCSY